MRTVGRAVTGLLYRWTAVKAPVQVWHSVGCMYVQSWNALIPWLVRTPRLIVKVTLPSSRVVSQTDRQEDGFSAVIMDNGPDNCLHTAARHVRRSPSPSWDGAMYCDEFCLFVCLSVSSKSSLVYETSLSEKNS